MRVLIVDDYPGAADIACVLIRLLGHDARPATTGAEAIAETDTYKPDVIILDLRLPDFNGFEVARRIRALPERQPFIAALSGWDQPDKRVQALAAGIDMYVRKPPSAENMTEILDAAKQRLSDRA